MHVTVRERLSVLKSADPWRGNFLLSNCALSQTGEQAEIHMKHVTHGKNWLDDETEEV